MFADVLRATQDRDLLTVVTSDRDAEAVALAFGCSIVADPGLGLNRAVAEGLAAAWGAGATAAVVLPCDVPLVTSDDIERLFEQPSQVAVVPSKDGGTNALMSRLELQDVLSYGTDSARLHIDRATAKSLTACVVQIERLALDIDDLEDLKALARRREPLASVRVARQILAG